jgi:hypothetical protein
MRKTTLFFLVTIFFTFCGCHETPKFTETKVEAPRQITPPEPGFIKNPDKQETKKTEKKIEEIPVDTEKNNDYPQVAPEDITDEDYPQVPQKKEKTSEKTGKTVRKTGKELRKYTKKCKEDHDCQVLPKCLTEKTYHDFAFRCTDQGLCRTIKRGQTLPKNYICENGNPKKISEEKNLAIDVLIPKAPEELPETNLLNSEDLLIPIPQNTSCKWSDNYYNKYASNTNYYYITAFECNDEYEEEYHSYCKSDDRYLTNDDIKKCYPKNSIRQIGYEEILYQFTSNLAPNRRYEDSNKLYAMTLLMVNPHDNHYILGDISGASKSFRQETIKKLINNPIAMELLYNWAIPIIAPEFQKLNFEDKINFIEVLVYARIYLEERYNPEEEQKYHDSLDDKYEFLQYDPDQNESELRNVEAFIFRLGKKGMSKEDMLYWLNRLINDLKPKYE